MAGIVRYLIPVRNGVMAIPFTTAFCASDEKDTGKCPLPPLEDEKPKVCKKKCDKAPKDSELEKCIARCRQEYGPAVVEYSERTFALARDYAELVRRNVVYLQKCAPEDVKVGTIIGGGLFGMLLGFRRGFIRKIFYGAIGSSVTAAIIYPNEATIIAAQGYTLGCAYAIMAYNYATEKAAPKEKKDCKKDKQKECAAKKEDRCQPKSKQD